MAGWPRGLSELAWWVEARGVYPRVYSNFPQCSAKTLTQGLKCSVKMTKCFYCDQDISGPKQALIDKRAGIAHESAPEVVVARVFYCHDCKQQKGFASVERWRRHLAQPEEAKKLLAGLVAFSVKTPDCELKAASISMQRLVVDRYPSRTFPGERNGLQLVDTPLEPKSLLQKEAEQEKKANAEKRLVEKRQDDAVTRRSYERERNEFIRSRLKACGLCNGVASVDSRCPYHWWATEVKCPSCEAGFYIECKPAEFVIAMWNREVIDTSTDVDQSWPIEML